MNDLDHIAEARKHDANGYTDEYTQAAYHNGRALTHAVLALVAEQRTANLIALANWRLKVDDGPSRLTDRLWDAVIDRMPGTVVNP